MSFKSCYCDYDPCRCKSVKKHKDEESCYESCDYSSKCHSESPSDGGYDGQLVFGSLYRPTAPGILTGVTPLPPAAPSITLGGLVSFTEAGPYLRALPDVNTSTIRVLSSGVYDIRFRLNISSFFAAAGAVGTPLGISVSVFVNQNVDPRSTATLNLFSGGSDLSDLSGSVLRYLNKGDIITLRFSAITGPTTAALPPVPVAFAATYGNAALEVTEVFNATGINPFRAFSLGNTLPSNPFPLNPQPFPGPLPTV